MVDSLPELPDTDPSSGTSQTLPAPPVKGLVKSGVIWIVGCFAVMQIVRFGSTIVLARLLAPEMFGLFSLAIVFLIGLHLFSDLGIRISIIQNPRGDDPAFLNTAWTIQCIRGFLIWLGTFVLAWPAAFWRPQAAPDLLWLVPAIGFSAVIEGFTSTKFYGLHRHLQQRKIVLIELFGSLGSTAVTICWAYFDRSPMAMVAGTLTNSIVQVFLSQLLPGPRNRFHLDRDSTHQLMHFGRWVFLSTLFNFLADQSTLMVLSLAVPMAILGVYHVANQIATIPATLMSAMARQLIMPLFTRLVEAGKDMREALATIQVRAGAATSLLIAGVLAVAPTLISAIYDNRFAAASWMVQMIAIAMMVQIFDVIGSALLFAHGKPRLYALSNLTKIICLAVFMPIAVFIPIGQNNDAWRVGRMIVALILGELGRYICTGLALRWHGLSIFRRDIGWSAFALATGFSMHHLANSLGLIVPAVGRKWPVQIELMLLEGSFVVVCWCIVVGFGWKAGWFKTQEEAREKEEMIID